MRAQTPLKKTIDSLCQAIQEAETDEERLAAEEALATLIGGLKHTFLGPTWATDEDGSWILPERTLGWQIAAWCMTYLRDPNSSEEDPRPWEFTDEQLRFLLWWYAVDENGRFLFRKGVLQRLKGWGKDPLLAVICLVEFVGPCRFSHWVRDGQQLGWDDVLHPGDEPVAIPEPNSLVQLASAASQDQTANTSDMLILLVSPELMRDYRIEKFSTSTETVRAKGGRQKLRRVTSNYRALEGSRATFVVLNETHHWVEGNQGIKMYETVDGNITKSGGRGARYLAITNAYMPGEDSVAERMRQAFNDIAEGKAEDVGFLYDSIEAHELVPLHPVALRVVIPIIKGDAWWLDVESILASVQSRDIPESRSRRMWLNQITSVEDQLYSETDWDELECDDYLKPGETIVLGFDGGRTDDSTALVAIRVSDMLAVALGIWEKTGEGWVVNHDQVKSKVAETFRDFEVVGFYADVNQWEEAVADWHTAYVDQLQVRATEGGNAVAWDMRRTRMVAMAHERLHASITRAVLKWTATWSAPLAAIARRHVLNVFAQEETFGLLFRKENRESPRKIDFYAALLLAHECLYDWRIKGKKPATKPGRVWMVRR